MISTNDLERGTVLNLNGELYVVLERQHHKPGKGRAVVRTKLRHLIRGNVISKTFTADEKVEDVPVERRKLQYLYQDGTEYVFMDMNTYDELRVPEEVVGDAKNYIIEGMEVEGLYANDELVLIKAPDFVVLEVIETEPGERGDRVSTAMKPAKLASGITIMVPIFINTGDKVKVNTLEGKYVERV